MENTRKTTKRTNTNLAKHSKADNNHKNTRTTTDGELQGAICSRNHSLVKNWRSVVIGVFFCIKIQATPGQSPRTASPEEGVKYGETKACTLAVRGVSLVF